MCPLAAGGLVVNQVTGTISAYSAVFGGYNGAPTVVNAGTSGGKTRRPFPAPASISGRGGDVTNQGSGTITGANGIAGGNQATTLTVVNAGSILGTNHGILLNAGGDVTNQGRRELSAGIKGSTMAAAAPAPSP